MKNPMMTPILSKSHKLLNFGEYNKLGLKNVSSQYELISVVVNLDSSRLKGYSCFSL
jgi:hypothetical protein